jgi:hypothetical protein
MLDENNARFSDKELRQIKVYIAVTILMFLC